MGLQAPAGILLAKPLADGRPQNKKTPDGYRHEALSLRLYAERRGSIAKDPVAYLTGTHHGFGRPFLPNIPQDTKAFTFAGLAVDTATPHASNPDEWAELVSYMHGTYGIWGTAYLEAIFRLADQEQSRREQEAPPPAVEVRDVPHQPMPEKGPGDTVELGLVARHPAGYLACLGLLRRCAEIPELRSTKLSWTPIEQHAVLTLPSGVTFEALCKLVEQGQGKWLNRPDCWFMGTPGFPSGKLSTDDLLMVEKKLSPAECMFLAGYLQPRPKGFQKQPFFATIGPQKLNAIVADIDRLIQPGTLERALLGKGLKEKDCSSLGLYPDTWVPRETYLSLDREKDKGVTVQNGIPWISRLALDSSWFLTLTPSGLTLIEEGVACWPTWEQPLGLVAVFRLLQVFGRRRDLVNSVYRSLPYPVSDYADFRKWPVRDVV